MIGFIRPTPVSVRAASFPTPPAPAPRYDTAPNEPPVGLGRQAEEAFARLGAADRQALKALHRTLRPSDRRLLDAALTRQDFAKTDSQGHSLAHNLAALAALKPPDEAPFTSLGLVTQVLAQLGDGGLINQGDRNTCGATTVQYILLTTQPAEYVRLVTGLAGSGRVTLQSGATLTRVTDSLAADSSGRDDVERLMQAAFQDHGVELRGRYSNVNDEFQVATSPQAPAWKRLGARLLAPVNWLTAKLDARRGISEGKVAQLYREVLGRPARLVGDLPGGVLVAPDWARKNVYSEVAAAVKAGKAVPVDVVHAGLQDTPGAIVEQVLAPGGLGYADTMRTHQLLVTRIENGQVYYRNPWGYDSQMSEREFKSRLTDAIIPGPS